VPTPEVHADDLRADVRANLDALDALHERQEPTDAGALRQHLGGQLEALRRILGNARELNELLDLIALRTDAAAA
jgi:hypothetical protein